MTSETTRTTRNNTNHETALKLFRAVSCIFVVHVLSIDEMCSKKYEAPATQGESHLGAGASWLRAAGGDSTCAGRVTASQRGRVAEIQFNKEPLGTERLVRRRAQLPFSTALGTPET